MAVDQVSGTEAVALMADPVPDRISQHAVTAVVGDPVPERIEQVQLHAIVSEPIPDRVSNVEVLVFVRDNRYELVGGPGDPSTRSTGNHSCDRQRQLQWTSTGRVDDQ